MRSRERRPGATASRTEDPLSADRRTLIVAAVAMVGLVAVGVVSGALFATSACDDIAPGAVTAGSAGPDLTGAGIDLVRAAGLAEGELEEAVSTLVAPLGTLTGVAEATGATRLASGPTGPVALGSTATSLGADGSVIEASAGVADGTIVGSGETLYSLALTNELTGQVDALQPLDAGLSGLTCVDTALVGSPLAFHLDAGQGELLLLRVEEDGEEPMLELRDPVAGRVWSADLELPTAPAGLAGARLTARMGDHLVVAGTRVHPGDGAPALTAVARADGGARWIVDRGELVAGGGASFDDGAMRTEVAVVGDGMVLVGLRAVEGGGGADEEAGQDAVAAGAHHLVALDPDDGGLLWSEPVGGAERVVDAEVVAGRAEVVLVDRTAGLVRWVTVDGEGLVERARTSVPGSGGASGAGTDAVSLHAGRIAVPDGGAVVVALGSELLVGRADGSAVLRVPLPAASVAARGGRVSVLVAGEGDRSLVLTFGG